MGSVVVVCGQDCKALQTWSIVGARVQGSVFSQVTLRPIKLGHLSLGWRMSTDKYPSL